jgi:hypothetical protein
MIMCIIYRHVPDKQTWSVDNKAPRLAGSFAYRNPIGASPDRPSHENPFAIQDDSPLIGGSLIGYLTIYTLHI